MKNNFVYKISPEAYKQYGYGRMEGNINLYAALTIALSTFVITAYFLYQVYK